MLSRLWKWGSVFIGALLWGNVEGRCFRRALEKREKFIYLGKVLIMNFRELTL
jgi:hypothetical protein